MRGPSSSTRNLPSPSRATRNWKAGLSTRSSARPNAARTIGLCDLIRTERGPGSARKGEGVESTSLEKPPPGIQVEDKGLKKNAITFLSNVNACYARACVEQIGFRDVPYAEDQAFGRDMLAAEIPPRRHPKRQARRRPCLRAGRLDRIAGETMPDFLPTAAGRHS